MTEAVKDPHITPTQFEWDEAKSTRNDALRGLPFDLAVFLFDGPTLEIQDTRHDYGEVRMQAIGMAAGRILVCVYTDRGPDLRRIISLRAANRKESHAYRATFPC